MAPGRGAPARTLPYDLALPYATGSAGPTLPRLDVGVEFLGGPSGLVTVTPLLDTGAEISVFDGRVAELAGLSRQDVVRRARDAKPIHGLAYGGRVIEAHELEIVCYVGSAARFAELRLSALVTPPDTVALPVLGRAGFFEQVDVTFAEFEKMFYLRFRNPALLRLFR